MNKATEIKQADKERIPVIVGNGKESSEQPLWVMGPGKEEDHPTGIRSRNIRFSPEEYDPGKTWSGLLLGISEEYDCFHILID